MITFKDLENFMLRYNHFVSPPVYFYNRKPKLTSKFGFFLTLIYYSFILYIVSHEFIERYHLYSTYSFKKELIINPELKDGYHITKDETMISVRFTNPSIREFQDDYFDFKVIYFDKNITTQDYVDGMEPKYQQQLFDEQIFPLEQCNREDSYLDRVYKQFDELNLEKKAMCLPHNYNFKLYNTNERDARFQILVTYKKDTTGQYDLTQLVNRQQFVDTYGNELQLEYMESFNQGMHLEEHFVSLNIIKDVFLVEIDNPQYNKLQIMIQQYTFDNYNYLFKLVDDELTSDNYVRKNVHTLGENVKFVSSISQLDAQERVLAKVEVQLDKYLLKMNRQFSDAVIMIVRIMAQVNLMFAFLFGFVVKYQNSQQMQDAAQKILFQKIPMKFYDYFNGNFLLNRYGMKKVKQVYETLDLNYSYKIKRKIQIMQNMIFSKKARLIFKVMVKNKTNFDDFLKFFQKKFYQIQYKHKKSTFAEKGDKMKIDFQQYDHLFQNMSSQQPNRSQDDRKQKFKLFYEAIQVDHLEHRKMVKKNDILAEKSFREHMKFMFDMSGFKGRSGKETLKKQYSKVKLSQIKTKDPRLQNLESQQQKVGKNSYNITRISRQESQKDTKETPKKTIIQPTDLNQLQFSEKKSPQKIIKKDDKQQKQIQKKITYQYD